ncbi:Hydrogen cyanide synthase subunit HcnA [bioreactor metagenome]|uniref:Hydrogen cyanide synthase subunit HcnA n=1 Tax=bioreactor metagenome TaxID=1076179 RepID=A0A645BN48_9ZZZZ
MNRVTQHPILELTDSEPLTFFYNGSPLPARQGDTIASALTANGIRVFRHTARRHETRGLFCAIGQCTDCVMVVNGRPNVRACVTPVEPGMRVETQSGLGGGSHAGI